MSRQNVYGECDRYYTITSDSGNEYRVMIREMSPIYSIFIGAHKRCITITKFAHEEFAHIEGISWDTKRSSGTIDMIRASLLFLIKLFPKLRYVSLIDESRIICNENTNVHLAQFHFLKHGKTWYEDKFSAFNVGGCSYV